MRSKASTRAGGAVPRGRHLRSSLFFYALLVVFFTGCGSFQTQELPELNVALAELQRIAITNLPLGKRYESPNGREYFSEYFVTKGGEFEPAEGSPIRSTVRIQILGDRRPYRLTVRVDVEKRSESGQFRLAKYDEGLAKAIVRKIQSALHKRRDGRNIIDDFRVF